MAQTEEELNQCMDIVLKAIEDLIQRTDVDLDNTLQNLQDHKCVIPSIASAQNTLQIKAGTIESNLRRLLSCADIDSLAFSEVEKTMNNVFLPYLVMLNASNKGTVALDEVREIEKALLVSS